MNLFDESLTLDPPGSIAVIGGGALGIESALYGRFLGYDVTVYESIRVGHSYEALGDAPLPVLPDRFLSPLAHEALSAQLEDSGKRTLPTDYRSWLDDCLIPLSTSDLLAGRVLESATVRRIELVQVEAEPDDEEEIPPDFRIVCDDESKPSDFESVILTSKSPVDLELAFPLPAPYFFRIEHGSSTDDEQEYLAGLKQIVAIFSQLSGRSDLDLYQPRRR